MPLPVPLPAEAFTLDYYSDQELLVARWLRNMTLAEMQASYAAILAAAQAHGNCRHWLLDVRRRTVGDPVALAWFRQDFSPQLVPVLGGSLSVAYFAMITLGTSDSDAALLAGIAQGEAEGAHYRYFNREDEARAWLNQQP